MGYFILIILKTGILENDGVTDKLVVVAQRVKLTYHL
jgi:hypothetical protein